MFPDLRYLLYGEMMTHIIEFSIIKMMYLRETTFSKSGDRVIPTGSRKKDESTEQTFNNIDWSLAVFIKYHKMDSLDLK